MAESTQRLSCDSTLNHPFFDSISQQADNNIIPETGSQKESPGMTGK